MINWLYQIEHYFAIHDYMGEIEKVDFCKFYLKDDALVWYQWFEEIWVDQLLEKNLLMNC